MTYETIKELFCRGKFENARKFNKRTDQELYDKVIAALEKQITKKVICFVRNPTAKRIGAGYCPICKTLVTEWGNYCSRCGQRVDWGNDSE